MCKYNLLVAYLSFITVSEYFMRIEAFRVFDVDGAETILASENENINIECKTDMPMAYCGFIHPTGKRYSFSGSTLNAGHCAIKIKASKNDSGVWRCHIGTQETGLEIMQSIEVRVVTKMAALKQNVTAIHGKPITLSCATTKLTPMSYCRFEPPTGQPFSINSGVTAANPILGRYYFPSNKSLDRGDCAVTIRKVKYEDVGSWTCGAGLEDGKEYIDFIKLDVEGLYTMSTASATGITFGAIGIGAILAVLGFVAWKKRRFLGAVRPDAEETEGHEMEQLPERRTPQRTPQPGRSVPQVTVETPSDPSQSPLMSRTP
ncbi:uncharacterized protein LOC113507691 [Trichoplusia ni]|uniref:Uncharacterized protein LOC113507691 n=1 Tax=Trichoplusia ni TaxID=7111 RepID=A0A7E5X1T2_TRINI|nr:uncharacterized protein LOC113507691 [Trichoplusia ni]